VDEDEGAGAGLYRHQILNKPRERHFSEGADGQARNGDAQLHAGNDAMQVTEEDFDDFGLGIAASHKLANTREPNSDKGELYCGEEAIQGYQNQYTNQADQKHRRGNPPSGIVAALAGKRRDEASRRYAKNKTGVEEEEAMPGAVARCVRVHYTGFSELR